MTAVFIFTGDIREAQARAAKNARERKMGEKVTCYVRGDDGRFRGVEVANTGCRVANRALAISLYERERVYREQVRYGQIALPDGEQK
jgi:hypothetical protein